MTEATDNFAVVRETIDLAHRLAGAHGDEYNARWSAGRAALTAIEAELAALRENALDLSKVPEGWTVGIATLFDDSWSVWLRDKTKHLTEDKSTVNGIGPTPSAALSAAIARIGGEG